jgi:GDPmannose 4,6-dehydratase
MYLILQQEKPEDFVLATGITTYIRDFVKMSFAEVGIELGFKGEAENEEGYIVTCNNPEYQLPIGKTVVKVDPRYYRPTEVELLIGDPTKANTKLGWKPKYTLEEMCAEMVASDLVIFKKERHIKQSGL